MKISSFVLAIRGLLASRFLYSKYIYIHQVIMKQITKSKRSSIFSLYSVLVFRAYIKVIIVFTGNPKQIVDTNIEVLRSPADSAMSFFTSIR